MNRYWVSWWSGYYESEGCTAPPFQVWTSGERSRLEGFGEDLSICAVIDADNEEQIEASIKKHFPDYEMRFIEKRNIDYVPGSRFPNFENKTKLCNEQENL